MGKIGVEKTGQLISKTEDIPYIEYGFSKAYKVEYFKPLEEVELDNYTFEPRIAIKGNKKEIFKAFYFKDTPDTRKGRAKWIARPEELYSFTAKDKSSIIGDMVEIKIEPKYCGTKIMVIEPFMTTPSNKFPSKLLVFGEWPKKTLSTTWSKEQEGSALSGQLKFGDNIWLNAKLEGCNGVYLQIEIYHVENFGHELLPQIYTGMCYDGELNIQFRDTYNWQQKHGYFKDSTEKYYAKIKIKGSKTYIGSKTKDLVFKFQTSSKTVKLAETARPLKLGQNEINIERYETCRFKKLTFWDNNEDISLFDEQKLGVGGESPMKKFAVSRTINFDLDQDYIRQDAALVLNKLAKFLKNSPFIPVELGAHCDIRKDHKYNDDLSNRRARSSREYLIKKGVGADRITGKGHGKRQLLINGEDLTESQHEKNRRVTIRFMLSGGDSQSLIYETFAPDITAEKTKKHITLVVDGLDSTEHCFKKGTNLEHNTEVTILNDNEKPSKHIGTSNIVKQVYSPTSLISIAPIDFIWPHSVAPNIYKYHIHTCRYYFYKDRETIYVKVFPDIKWSFDFLLDLKNKASVKWANLSDKKHAEMQSEAGKIGAEKRWKQTDVKLQVVVKAYWNKINEDKYEDNFEIKKEFEGKIKQLYSIFSKLKEASKYITGKTKGKIVETRIGRDMPFTVVMDGPRLYLGAEWQCARGITDDKPAPNLGTEIVLKVVAAPLIKLAIVIDLLAIIVQGTLAATTGGTANAAAKLLLDEVKKWLSDEENPVNIDMYMDLELFGEISANTSLTYHTAAPNKASLAINTKVGITLTAGLSVKAKLVVIIAEFYANGSIKVKGEGSITFGHELNYIGTSHGGSLNYEPKMLFDGIQVEAIIKAEVGMKIRTSWFSFSPHKKLDDIEYKEQLVKPFDILETITGGKVSIPLISS
ncbi:OmpA family protein [Olleya sp. HaHaR_3_96]|uniref:OmpA family protein n=1 Tax=Olleya sp. HaHaR_3_96 TaxID=2745560 RepID=UPI001C4EFA02|nr:OmpA family protein [Olleya sp. HaHaR_3_96]QXP59310.1 OmpA family protein [Olleya sp. HaHaR_3_96]